MVMTGLGTLPSVTNGTFNLKDGEFCIGPDLCLHAVQWFETQRCAFGRIYSALLVLVLTRDRVQAKTMLASPPFRKSDLIR